MRVLIACEESQAVCKAFREKGHEAYSCDLQECSGGNSEWHIKGDALKEAYSGNYDLMVAHPPCTYLSKAGARWLHTKDGINEERLSKGIMAKDFFIKLFNAPIRQIAIENPLPLKIFNLPKENQIIQPCWFGHPFTKKTLLWLKDLPKLKPTSYEFYPKPFLPSNTGGKKRGQKYHYTTISQKDSSKTFHGIAKAMAEQWG